MRCFGPPFSWSEKLWPRPNLPWGIRHTAAHHQGAMSKMHLNVKLWLRVKGLGIGCVLTRSPFNLTMQWSISTLTCFCCVQVSITSCHHSVDSLQCLLCRALAFVQWILAQTKMCGFGISLGKCLPLHSVVKQTRDCEHTSFSGHFGGFFSPSAQRQVSFLLAHGGIDQLLPAYKWEGAL